LLELARRVIEGVRAGPLEGGARVGLEEGAGVLRRGGGESEGGAVRGGGVRDGGAAKVGGCGIKVPAGSSPGETGLPLKEEMEGRGGGGAPLGATGLRVTMSGDCAVCGLWWWLLVSSGGG